MSGGGAAARRKGADFERWLVHRFAEVFGDGKVRRGLQFRSGEEVPDVDAPGLWIEAKRRKRVHVRAALDEAVGDALGKGRWPVAVCKEDGAEPFVVMRLDDFLDLLREWWSTRGQ
ncbi:MAG: hypothetical protein IT379_08445 [Deltaproteobacteria bacterium]|nr:hypothetical protein [Deltaproteobacteria bacterium]